MVEHSAAVDFAGHLEGNARGDIGFNQAGNHVHAGALGGQNQVDAGGTRFLGKAGNELFDLLAGHHHQIGKLVHHHHDKRQFFQRFRVIRRVAERIGDFAPLCGGLGDFLVVAFQVAHADMAHQAVAFFHFVHAPGERVGGQLHVGDHGREQMRNAFIDGQFQHFRVNHNHADFFGCGFIQHRQNHAVHAHRFARTGGASHQQMRRFGKVGYHGFACNVFAQRKG